jgi:hypothetical protein
MANYVATGPFTNGGAPGLSASFFNAIENVFIQPGGGAETGHYFFEGNANGSGGTIGVWVVSLSRTTAPVSVTIDTADTSPVGVGSPSVQAAKHSGFFVGAAATGATNTGRAGGNYTINY